MEDGIENNRSTLYDRMELEKKFLYVYIPVNSEWCDYILLHEREKALDLVKKNDGGKIEVFLQNFDGQYKLIYKI